MELYFPLVLDGATGTELQKKGFSGAVCAEQWVLDHPQAIAEIQQSYVKAGSQIVYSPTFGANRVKLEERGIFNAVSDFNARLAQISRQAVQGRALVAGDLAPTGKMLAPLGDVSFEELLQIYREQAAALEPYVDLFVIETMITMAEARAALLAVKSVGRKPVFVTFSCDEHGKTLTGTDVTAALTVLQSMGADAFGLNCSVGPREMLEQIRRLAEYAEVPLIAKPNAGMPQIIHGKTVYTCTPEEFAACVPALAEAGVCIFGGCCGSGAGHIAAIAEAVKNCPVRLPEPRHRDGIVLSTEKRPVLLPADIQPGPVLPCDGNLADALEEIEDTELLTLSLAEEADLDNLADCQYQLTAPLCFACSDAALLEKALKLYQGRAMYDGPLPEEELKPLAEKYGLVY